MSEEINILDSLVSEINKKTGKEIQVYLSMDNSKKEFLTFKTEKHERGIPLDDVVNAYGRFRMYSASNEEEALDKLTSNVAESIQIQLEDLDKVEKS